MILPFYFSDNEAIKGKDFIYFIKFPTLCIITHIRGFSFLWEYGCLFLPVDSSFMEKKYLGKICIWAFFDWSLKAFFKFAFFFFTLYTSPSSLSLRFSHPPHLRIAHPHIHSLEGTRSPFWYQQSLAYEVEVGPGPSLMHQGWARNPPIGNGLQKPSSKNILYRLILSHVIH